MILLIWVDPSRSVRSNRITGCGDLALKRQGVQITFCHVLTAQLVTKGLSHIGFRCGGTITASFSWYENRI